MTEFVNKIALLVLWSSTSLFGVSKSALVGIKSQLLLRDITLSLHFLGDFSPGRVNTICEDGVDYLRRHSSKESFISSRFARNIGDIASVLGVYAVALDQGKKHVFFNNTFTHSPWLVGKVVAFVALFHSVKCTKYVSGHALLQQMARYRPLGFLSKIMHNLSKIEYGMYGKLVVLGGCAGISFQAGRRWERGFDLWGYVADLLPRGEQKPEQERVTPETINKMFTQVDQPEVNSTDSQKTEQTAVTPAQINQLFGSLDDSSNEGINEPGPPPAT